jgi:hypothetical protein
VTTADPEFCFKLASNALKSRTPFWSTGFAAGCECATLVVTGVAAIGSFRLSPAFMPHVENSINKTAAHLSWHNVKLQVFTLYL